MQPLMSAEEGFLAFPETELATLENAKVVVQLTPYEHSSSYLMGSDKGPAAMVEASHFVEFYDEEINLLPTKPANSSTAINLWFPWVQNIQ